MRTMDIMVLLCSYAFAMSLVLYLLFEIADLEAKLEQEQLNVIALSGIYEGKNDICKEQK